MSETASVQQQEAGRFDLGISTEIAKTNLKLAFGTRYQSFNRKLVGIGYYTAPASRGHHLAECGGLVKHCVNVTDRLKWVSEDWSVPWPRQASPYLVGMLHDLVKCRCYRAVEGAGPAWEYVQPEYHGHGACSVAIAAELGIQLMREEIAAIMFHMGPWGVGKEYSESEFRAAMRVFAPFIIATHTADWYAAEVDEREVGS